MKSSFLVAPSVGLALITLPHSALAEDETARTDASSEEAGETKRDESLGENAIFIPSVSAQAGRRASAGSQGNPPGDVVFDDNWMTLGIGLGVAPSYSGSDDYVINPAPLIRGQLGPVEFNPRPAGFAANVIPKSQGNINFQLGPTLRVRLDRAVQVEDEVVELAEDLDVAVEAGVAAGVTFSDVLTKNDTLLLNVDTRWDIAGAHEGMVIEPGFQYAYRVGRAATILFGANLEFVDDDYAAYYYSVSPEQSAATGLPLFDAEGGLNSVGTNILATYDLDGNALNGGLGVFGILGYTRLVNDAEDTPFTDLRGDPNQFTGAIGISYTF